LWGGERGEVNEYFIATLLVWILAEVFNFAPLGDVLWRFPEYSEEPTLHFLSPRRQTGPEFQDEPL